MNTLQDFSKSKQGPEINISDSQVANLVQTDFRNFQPLKKVPSNTRKI